MNIAKARRKKMFYVNKDVQINTLVSTVDVVRIISQWSDELDDSLKQSADIYKALNAKNIIPSLIGSKNEPYYTSEEFGFNPTEDDKATKKAVGKSYLVNRSVQGGEYLMTISEAVSYGSQFVKNDEDNIFLKTSQVMSGIAKGKIEPALISGSSVAYYTAQELQVDMGAVLGD